jgi:hypothetical protein
MKFRVFWDVLPCSQVDVDGRFRGAYCLHHQGSETSDNIYLTTRKYISEDSKLHTRRRENLKSHIGGGVAQSVECVTKDWATVARSLKSKGFFSGLCVQTSSEAHPASYPISNGVLSQGIKRGRGVTLTNHPI